MTIDVIVNRNARRLRSGSTLSDTLAREAARGGARVHETRSLDELAAVAHRLAGEGTEAVVLAGGDGSHMAGVSALAQAFGNAMPPVALAPGGTVGTIAQNFAMHGASADAVVRAVCTRSTRMRRSATLRVRDDAGGHRVGFIFGTGLVARFFVQYDAHPKPGVGTAAHIAGRVLAGAFIGSPLAKRVLDPLRCRLSVDGVSHAAGEWSLVLASVVSQVGLGVRATYRGGETLDGFHVVASGLSPRGLAMQVPRVLAGKAMGGKPHVDAVAGSLRVTFDEPESAYVLDGDLLRAREVHVEAGPAITVLLPA